MKKRELSVDINQQFALLFRKWFISGDKRKDALLDKEQVDDLVELNYSSNREYFSYILDQHLPAVRIELPILTSHPTRNGFVFKDDVLIIGNVEIMSIHLPGTVGFGLSFEDSMKSYLRAIIENVDFHIHNDISLYDQDYYFQHQYNPQLTDIKTEDLINELSQYGWTKASDYPYNSILIHESVKSIITIPHESIIPPSIQVWYNKLMYPMTKKSYYQTYPTNQGTEARDEYLEMCDAFGEDPDDDILDNLNCY